MILISIRPPLKPRRLDTLNLLASAPGHQPVLQRALRHLWHRLPRGALPERSAAVPGLCRAAGRAVLLPHQADVQARAEQAGRPGNQERTQQDQEQQGEPKSFALFYCFFSCFFLFYCFGYVIVYCDIV